MKKKALIAMSGGVDSSVAAYLMKEQGYDCIGATMKLYDNEDVGISRTATCCSAEDVDDARSVAFSLGMPYYVFNFTEAFKEEVIGRFIQAYEQGRTPNPCIECNRYLKFEKFYRRMLEMGYDTVVTGHYVRIREDEGGRFHLYRSSDLSKDQSYVLYSLTQEQLSHAKFPLGELTKDEVRAIAQAQGFINAKKHESQDICFVQNGSYADFIEQYTGKTYVPGPFIGPDGNVAGEHKGIIRYTIGQRKGLGLAFGEPVYVTEVDPEANTVRLGHNEDLFTTTLEADEVNLIPFDHLTGPMRVQASIRYQAPPKPATVTETSESRLRLVFDQPQRAITLGQAVVLYDGDEVLGGGTICKKEV
ncbi:MAG: tRNA 2-thiouridine(34) synthase MnmA [Firmicutes bacterium]|nr:tRNA 2-thiouridine(34) synthase MnmA [Bacillota bacterium]